MIMSTLSKVYFPGVELIHVLLFYWILNFLHTVCSSLFREVRMVAI